MVDGKEIDGGDGRWRLLSMGRPGGTGSSKKGGMKAVALEVWGD
jgi:hypothetical protein